MVESPAEPGAGDNDQRGSAPATAVAEVLETTPDEPVTESVAEDLEPVADLESEDENSEGENSMAEALEATAPESEDETPDKPAFDAVAWAKRAVIIAFTAIVAFAKRAWRVIRRASVAFGRAVAVAWVAIAKWVAATWAALRSRAASTAERASAARLAARERAAAAREAAAERTAERAASRALARIEHVSAEPAVIDTDLSFDLVPVADAGEFVLVVDGLTKRFDDKLAVSGVSLRVPTGSFYGIVGPNGAGKTTTLSMITGLLRPDAGTVAVHGADVWSDPVTAKRNMGVLPDRLRLFDRLTGAQLLFYAGVLRGLDAKEVRRRSADLAAAFGLEEGLARLVSDYSAGMTKKIALAAALIHSPRLLVLDEPFESVDPVSAANVTNILKQYAAAGGTVVLSSHSMDLVQRICDHVAVVVGGVILADGTMDQVRDGRSLEDRFIELAGARTRVEGLPWLQSFSD